MIRIISCIVIIIVIVIYCLHAHMRCRRDGIATSKFKCCSVRTWILPFLLLVRPGCPDVIGGLGMKGPAAQGYQPLPGQARATVFLRPLLEPMSQ